MIKRLSSSPPAFVVITLVISLAACTGVPLLSPFRIDVQQGNVLTQEMVSQLKPGMSRDQVKFVLGTPLLTDMFHANRWDYVYRLQRGNGQLDERRIAVFFENDALLRVEGDVVAQAGSPASAAGANKPAAKSSAPPRQANEEKGFFGRLRDKIGL